MNSVFSIERKYPCREMDIEKLNCDKKETTMNIKYDKELVKSISEQKEKLISEIGLKIYEAEKLYRSVCLKMCGTVTCDLCYKPIDEKCNVIKLGDFGGVLRVYGMELNVYRKQFIKETGKRYSINELKYINDNIEHDMQIIIDAVIKQAQEE